MIVVLAMALSSFGAAGAVAQSSTPSTEASAEEAREAARVRFARALELFDEGSYAEALIEFRAAYALHADHRVLYNVGNVHAALGQPVEAVDAWQRYLDEGGEAIDAERRREVEAAAARQRTRIGELFVHANVDGARVVIDGVEVATLPLAAPLRLAIGSYAVGVRAAGYEPSARRVSVAGQSAQRLELVLERSAREVGSLRIRTGVPGVVVRVGEREVGTTPFTETIAVSPGEHVIAAHRVGYRPFRAEVHVDHGQETEVTITMALDPDAPSEHLGTLRLHLPQPASAVRLDGLALSLDGGVARIPTGPHELVIELPEREPVRERLVVVAGEPIELQPTLRWTPEARRTRIDRARSQRRWGAAVLAVGVAAAGASAAVLGWNEHRGGELATLEPAYRACLPGSVAECDLQTERDAQRYVSLDDAVRRARALTIGGLVLGVVTAGVGVIVLARAPSEAAIDAGAQRERVSWRVGVGIAGVAVDGRF